MFACSSFSQPPYWIRWLNVEDWDGYVQWTRGGWGGKERERGEAIPYLLVRAIIRQSTLWKNVIKIRLCKSGTPNPSTGKAFFNYFIQLILSFTEGRLLLFQCILETSHISRRQNLPMTEKHFSSLMISAHVKSVSIKTTRRIGVLSRLRKLIPVEAKLAIYKSAILPYFSYCSLVWHFCKASDRRKLERINERGLRTVFDNWKQPYEDLLRRAKLTTLTNKRLQDIATFMYKAKHKMLPPPVQELFTTGHTRYNLRNSDLFRTEHFNTKKYGKHALCYYGPSLWSKLDRKLRASTSLGSFKNAIKKMDLEALMSDCSTCSLCNSYFYFCILFFFFFLFFLEGSPVLTVMPIYYLTLIYYCI